MNKVIAAGCFHMLGVALLFAFVYVVLPLAGIYLLVQFVKWAWGS